MRNSTLCSVYGLVALAIVFLCSGHLLCAQEPPAGPTAADGAGEFRIAGLVVSQTSGTPLSRTRVSIVAAGNPRSARWMVTGDDGHFAFQDLSAGKYSLQGARRGFIATTYDQHGQFSTAIVTGAGVDTENLVLRLVPTAKLTGKVLDESGEPVRNASVRLFRENHAMGFSQISPFGWANTDDQGTYEFSPVIPGNYFLSASARPWYAIHPALSTTNAQGAYVDPALDVSYPQTYYSGTTESDSATLIPIKGGDQLQFDLHLEPVPSLHLFFHVPENGQGFQWPNLQRRVFDTLEDSGAEAGGQQEPGGRFEMTGVAPGKYTVHLHGASPQDAGQVTEINLTKDSQDLDAFPGESLSSLKVSAQMAGEGKLPQQFFIGLRDAHLRNVAFQQADANGEARFDNLAAGKYSIMAVSRTMAYSVVKTSGQGTESSGNGVNVTPGSALSVTAVLLGGSTRVEGFVKRGGKPAPGIMVVLVPANPEANIELFRRDQSDLDGSFTLPAVVPGTYTVIAIEDGWTLDWSRPAVLAHYTSRGQKVVVSAQGRREDPVRLSEPVEVQAR
jgi:Carboxypeptidase regulatory-like domain